VSVTEHNSRFVRRSGFHSIKSVNLSLFIITYFGPTSQLTTHTFETGNKLHSFPLDLSRSKSLQSNLQ
jgi:hypothetical protein